jgi:hypothetical protein
MVLRPVISQLVPFVGTLKKDGRQHRCSMIAAPSTCAMGDYGTRFSLSALVLSSSMFSSRVFASAERFLLHSSLEVPTPRKQLPTSMVSMLRLFDARAQNPNAVVLVVMFRWTSIFFASANPEGCLFRGRKSHVVS